MNGLGDDARTALVVDDEPDLCEVVRRVLDGRGYAVLAAAGAAEAVSRCDAHRGPIEIVVTDVRMPDGNGPELARRIQQKHPEAAVLYMSGLPGRSTAVAEVSNDGPAVLAKPFTPTELLAAVDRALVAHSRGNHLEDSNRPTTR